MVEVNAMVSLHTPLSKVLGSVNAEKKANVWIFFVVVKIIIIIH